MSHFIEKSKNIINKISVNIHISICIPIYDEINRFKTQNEHPNGEDFLNVKLKQCEELFEENKKITFNLLLIDDGCPNKTGKFIERYIKDNNIEKSNVIYLEDCIKNGIFRNINNVNDSRKGAAIYYGFYYSIHKLPKIKKKHIIIYTDADISTDLRQCGLLIEKILEGYSSCIACRHLPESITIKKGSRSVRAKIHSYFWKKLFEEINYLSDTQTSFKAFDSKIIPNLLDNINEFKFSFDIEILLKCNKLSKISQIPIYWKDSPNESKTNKLEYYLEILQSMSKLYKIYIKDKTGEKDKISLYLENMSIEEYKKILNIWKCY